LPDPVVTRGLVRRETYRDSVALMRVAAALEALPEIQQAAVLMATSANRELLMQAGFDQDGQSTDWASAGPTDLVVVVRGAAPAVEAALQRAAELLDGAAEEMSGERSIENEEPIHTLTQGLARLPGARLALISTPGTYAAAEGLKALKHGLHVFCFSDNVALADEVRLKQLAAERGLLFMGPDCGTAVIDGVPIGFANVVKRGRIGLVGASGTGLQEVMCLLDRSGEGISQVIGVGSHDLHPQVGGIMMRAGLERLAADPETEVVVAISKPPDPAVATALLQTAGALGKPIVICFLGVGFEDGGNVRSAATLEATATLARKLGGSTSPDSETSRRAEELGVSLVPPRVRSERVRLVPYPGRRLLGLFSGGTLCAEAEIVLRQELDVTRTDGPPFELIDLGDDWFTVGRPHPMIDLRDRALRISSTEPDVSVILLDVVLGYGSHQDPASVLAPSIARSLRQAHCSGHPLAVVASVTGTEGDPQGLRRQCEVLLEAGAQLAPSNAAAARLAARLLCDGGAHG
jgi:FdrA protein